MSAQFDEVVKIMATLRDEGGCPWDRKQTPQSLAPYLIEESYEVLETKAITPSGRLIRNTERQPRDCAALFDASRKCQQHDYVSRRTGESVSAHACAPMECRAAAVGRNQATGKGGQWG